MSAPAFNRMSILPLNFAGNELENLMKNPSLSDLLGGIASVTLGDDEAKRRGVQKSVLERQVGLLVVAGQRCRTAGQRCIRLVEPDHDNTTALPRGWTALHAFGFEPGHGDTYVVQ